MPTRTLYVRDEPLWTKAQKLAGEEGLSGVVHQLLTDWVRRKEAEMEVLRSSDQMHDVQLSVGGTAHETRDEDGIGAHQIAFTGRLLADSEGFSVAQMPRVQVYQTKSRKLIVYRTWKGTPADESGATYDVYPDYDALSSDPFALQTMWIEGDPDEDAKADYTPELQRKIARALGEDVVIRIN